LRISRTRRRQSIREAANLAQVSPSAWQRYESGQNPLGIRQAAALADMLGEPIPGFNLNQPVAPATAIFEAPQVIQANPDISASLVVKSIFSLDERGNPETDSEIRTMLCEAHIILGTAMLHMGDHDLGGQSFCAALRIGQPEDFTNYSIHHIRAGTLWSGYPFIKNPSVAAKRLAMLERESSKMKPAERGWLSLMRAMFADWAGYQETAFELTEGYLPPDGQSIEPLAVLMRAWLFAKYGNRDQAFKLAEPFFESDDPFRKFLAYKVALEAHTQSAEMKNALECLSVLQKIDQEYGIWAPDLNAKLRRLELA
jgi:transcriptional regulator with XRE-family HTH domain